MNLLFIIAVVFQLLVHAASHHEMGRDIQPATIKSMLGPIEKWSLTLGRILAVYGRKHMYTKSCCFGIAEGPCEVEGVHANVFPGEPKRKFYCALVSRINRYGQVTPLSPMSHMGFLDHYWKHGTRNINESLTFEMRLDGDKVLWVHEQQKGNARRALDLPIVNVGPDEQKSPHECIQSNNHKRGIHTRI